ERDASCLAHSKPIPACPPVMRAVGTMTSLRWTTSTIVPKLRDLKSKPLMLAENVYAGLHATHVSLFEVLSEFKLWTGWPQNLRQEIRKLGSEPLRTMRH